MATATIAQYNTTSAFIEEKISIASVNAGIVPIVLPPAFKELQYVSIGYTFVDVSEVPVTPGAGTITFEVKTVVNPDNAVLINNGTDIDATATPGNLFYASASNVLEVSGTGLTVATDVIIRIKGFAR